MKVEDEATDAEVKAMVLRMSAKLMAERAVSLRWRSQKDGEAWLYAACFVNELASEWEKK